MNSDTLVPISRETHSQESAYDSPHSFKRRLGILLWGDSCKLFCEWTPKPLNRWRLFWLRRFGAMLYGTPFVHPHARIHMPWNLIMHDRACLGDGAVAYTQGVIEIKARATV